MADLKNTQQQKKEILGKVLRKTQDYLERSERITDASEADALVKPKKLTDGRS